MGVVLLAYQGAPGVNAASFDLTALSDADFSQRNGHYIFTEQYKLLAAVAMEASAIRANFSCPTWNAIGKGNVWPVMVSAVIQSPPRADVRIDSPPIMPQMEEFQFQTSNNLGAATEQAYGLLLLGSADWNPNIQSASMPIEVRATATYNPGNAVWSGPNALTFEQALRGGVYSVVGAECQGANLIAFRLIFPRTKLYAGTRKLRPGWLCQQAIGDQVYPPGVVGPYWLGEWGRFHTFEPPQIESIMTTGASTTHEVRLWLNYLGPDPSLLST